MSANGRFLMDPADIEWDDEPASKMVESSLSKVEQNGEQE